MNDLIAFSMEYWKINNRTLNRSCYAPFEHCDWLEIVPLVMHAGTRMCALREGALYILYR